MYTAVLFIVLFAEPVRITGQSDITFSLGEQAELSCTFKGVPSPTVQWYFKGRLVLGRDVVTTPSSHTASGMSTLTIDNVQVKDIGSYQCVASNYLQSVQREFHLCGEGERILSYLKDRLKHL